MTTNSSPKHGSEHRGMTEHFTHGTLTTNGLLTHYLEAGEPGAPLVVLLHEGAFGASAVGSWAHVIPVLAERYHVIAPDLYGYGSSSKMIQFDVPPYEFRLRQVAALLDALGLGATRAHVIGNSFGGAMALRATTLDWFSWRLNSVVSFGGTGGPYRAAAGLDRLGRFDGTVEDMEDLVRFANGEFDGFAEQVAVRMEGATAGNYRSVMAPLMPAPFAAAPPADPYPEMLADTTVPLVAIAGKDDPFVEPGWAEKIAVHAPLGRALLIDGGHSPNVADPVGTAQLILDVLRENEDLLATQAESRNKGKA